MNRLLPLFLILGLGPVMQPKPVAPVNLRVDIAPTSYGPYELLRQQHPDTYTCSAILFDESNKRFEGRVEVIVRPGQELTKTTASNGLQMTIEGRIDAARNSAFADVTVIRDGVLIAHQQSRLVVARTNPRVYPNP